MYPRRVALCDFKGKVVYDNVPVRQCGEGLDDSPTAWAHHPHLWDYRNRWGLRRRWCRGWFPTVSTSRSLIEYFKPPAVRS